MGELQDARGVAAAVARLSDESRWKARREIRTLADHLEEDETVRAVARATELGSDGLLVVTNERVFFLYRDSEANWLALSYAWDAIATAKFDAGHIVISRRDAEEGLIPTMRRLLAVTPSTLELSVADTRELAQVYEALAGPSGALEDRALADDAVVAAARRLEQEKPAAAIPSSEAAAASRIRAAANEYLRTLAREWKQLREEPRNFALAVLGAAVAFGALCADALAFTETGSGTATTCSWDPDPWTTVFAFLGPVAASVLVVAGVRRSDSGAVWLTGIGAGIVILASLFFPGGWLLSLVTGTPLC